MLGEDTDESKHAGILPARLLAALTELLEMHLAEARKQRELEELDEQEWRLHCEQYGCEDLAYEAVYGLMFALDWS